MTSHVNNSGTRVRPMEFPVIVEQTKTGLKVPNIISFSIETLDYGGLTKFLFLWRPPVRIKEKSAMCKNQYYIFSL